jgi:2-polyprenyl-3-methyl-5-hydroxy-6-metoxy-1,4-benzoquinol methylase
MLPAGTKPLPDGFGEELRKQFAQDAPELIQEKSGRKRQKDYSFDLQWATYRYSNLSWELDLPTRVSYVHQYLRTKPDALRGALVLDAGCGNGTLSAALAATGPEVVGLDYSESVAWAEREKERFAGPAAHRIHYVQGDVQHPPFAVGTFDVVYCDGVLHHTPDTRASFEAISRLAKGGGRVFVWVYRSNLSVGYRVKRATIKTIQPVLRPLPRWLVKSLCYLGAAVLLALLRTQHWLGFRKRRRLIPVRLKAVSLLDTFTPQYDRLHTPPEVKSWFKDNGFPSPVETTIASLGHEGFGILGMREGCAVVVAKSNGRKVWAASVSEAKLSGAPPTPAP